LYAVNKQKNSYAPFCKKLYSDLDAQLEQVRQEEDNILILQNVRFSSVKQLWSNYAPKSAGIFLKVKKKKSLFAHYF
jgi:hypothetical protein